MFKDSFKFYKAKWPIPDFSDVLDFEKDTTKGIKEFGLDVDSIYEAVMPGLKPVYQWKCFEIADRPGLIFIRNPFTPQGQRYWMTRCVRDYPKHPNVVNLNTKLFSQSVIDDWWSSYQNCPDKDEKRRMKVAMRWTTLGYHHDWDTKHYSEQMKNKFPADLAQLSEHFSKALGLGKYSAEAAIVNYYPIGTTLAGHTDHSESDLEAPLFSFSFGQTAIFLLGGTTKEEKPSALFLRSGDVVVMSKESRLCYHAVPRVMKATTECWNEFSVKKDVPLEPPKPKKLKCEIIPPVDDEWQLETQLFENCADENFWSPFRQFVNDSRININVRQVLKEGQLSL